MVVLYCSGTASSIRSPSSSGIQMLTWSDLEVTISASRHSLERMTWIELHLSIAKAGTRPWHWISTPLQLITSTTAIQLLKTIPVLLQLSIQILFSFSFCNCHALVVILEFTNPFVSPC